MTLPIYLNIFLRRRLLASQKCILNRKVRARSLSSEVSSTPTLYFDEVSPPVRFVLMTAHCLGMQLKLHRVDLFKEENKTELYEKINPLHKVPAMKVNDTVIVDSHAISLYLCQKYNDRRLYPEDLLTRAKTNEMMFFNSSTLFPIDSRVFTDYFAGQPSVDETQLTLWSSAMNYLDTRLRESTWLSGDEMTLSDLCCVATVSSLELLVPLKDQYPRVTAWLQRMRHQPCYLVNQRGLDRLSSFVQLAKNINAFR